MAGSRICPACGRLFSCVHETHKYLQRTTCSKRLHNGSLPLLSPEKILEADASVRSQTRARES
eukprot:1335124-Prorocentrum_lima.AAC.1